MTLSNLMIFPQAQHLYSVMSAPLYRCFGGGNTLPEDFNAHG
jgi:hypothetical protein